MRPLTEDDVRDVFRNATAEELRMLALPIEFMLADWDHLDFFAWRDPRTRSRAYLIVELDGQPHGIVLRSAESTSRARSSMCNLCHTMQPGNQVKLFNARKGGEAGVNGDSIGTYICVDMSCHDNVRLAAPLAPSEFRASVDRKIDGTRRRVEDFVARVLETAGSRR
ncbi:FBP domain-containing protein [Microbacterium sp. C7(2022)]|uniref:FBP domain-containing protein n=1 Tax=Microbacterium sp. C7(2022) TaxID=2992759 RepID=UPI00237AD776|nr:FBP domain-containing protein [Microbacterium sp. C7(2022)]MDE0546128.1 FBP domain-containing protein [Microbacterium sp. C7(2022)]